MLLLRRTARAPYTFFIFANAHTHNSCCVKAHRVVLLLLRDWCGRFGVLLTMWRDEILGIDPPSDEKDFDDDEVNAVSSV